MAVNEAWNCDKGRFAFTHLTDGQRLTTPLERIDGELVETTWVAALRRVAAAVEAARSAASTAGAAVGSRTALVTGGRLADEDAFLAARYARTVLGTDHVEHRTRFAPADEAAARVALLGGTTHGEPTTTYADVERAPVIVVAGLDPEEEVPVLHLRLRKAWRDRTARIVVVGPTLGTLADLAWRRVACAPGEEAAALASLTAGISAGDGEVALALRDVEAPVVLVGERSGSGAIAAGAALAAAAGGKVAFVPRRSGDAGALAAGLAPGVLPGGRLLSDAADRAEVEAVWGPLPADLVAGASGSVAGAGLAGGLADILRTAADGGIDVLHLAGVDLVRDAASASLAEAALARVAAQGTVVVQDLAMTETVARFADVVLPVTATQERAGTRTDWEGRSQRFSRAVDGPKLTQDDWEAFVQLAALLGHDLGVRGLDDVRDAQARLGRRASAHPMPTVDAAAAGAAADGTLVAVVRPLLLDGGTMLAGADDLLATARPSTVQVGRADAVRLGLTDGQPVEITGADGTSVVLPAQVADDVIAGVVVLPRTPIGPDAVPMTRLATADGTVRVTLAARVAAEVGA
jgi:NADH-quinone oxidoreductase subunit G